MKKFLKKANRGVLLAGFALFLLVIYIYVDYSGFSEEQPKIQETVENYIEDFYKELSENDYEGIYKLVDEYWSDELIMLGNNRYYEDKEALSQFFEENINYKHKDKYGETSCTINILTVSKLGPGMAKARVNYSAEMELGADTYYHSPFLSYKESGYGYDEENNNRYIYTVVYQFEICLRKVDDEWKLVQATGSEQDSHVKIKESE